MSRVKVWKDALYPGTWVTTKGQVFRCDRGCLRHFHDRTRAMLSHGACIPWTYEHQHDKDDTTQLSANDLLARWAKNTGGHIHDVRLASPDGPLEVLIDVDESDIPKLEAIKFCSPDIRPNWRDRNGPEVDDVGPFWPGQSIAHLAMTPIPVQYPQVPFRFDRKAKGFPVSLSAAGVAVSLSAASYAKDEDMADKPDETPDELGATPEPEEAPGEDLEGGGSITPPEPVMPAEPTGDSAAEKTVMHDLATIATKLGVQLHSSAHEDLLSFVQHFCTAVMTHLDTKDKHGAGTPKPDEAAEPVNDHDEDDVNPNYQEPEVAESPPIQMSAATPNPAPKKPEVNPREEKLAKALLRQNSANLMGRIATLHARGFIDDKIKLKLENEVAAIRLSSGDVAEDGTITPSGVALRVEAYEDLMRSGKPGSFAKPTNKPAPPARKDKPVSTAVALSAGEEEVVDPPYGGDNDAPKPVNRDIVNRMSSGRYDGYLKDNGKA